MRKKAFLAALLAAALALGISPGCAPRPQEPSEAPVDQVGPEVSEGYIDALCESYAANDGLGNIWYIVDQFNVLQRLIDISVFKDVICLDASYSLYPTAKAEISDLVDIDESTKVYLNGTPASVSDLKPGYLIFYLPGEILESNPAQNENVSLLCAWEANNGVIAQSTQFHSDGTGFFSKEYQKELDSILEGADASGDFRQAVESLNVYQRVSENAGSSGLSASNDLATGSPVATRVTFSEGAKFFVNGFPASANDIKEGYLVCYYGGSAHDGSPSQYDGATFVSAWEANVGPKGSDEDSRMPRPLA